MNPRIKYENLIIIIYSFNRMKNGGANMKTAKLLYLFEDKLYKKNMIGSHYVMKKYQMGPYNNTIGTNLKNLAKNGYLTIKPRYFEKIDENVNVYFENLYTNRFIKKIDDLIQDYSEIFNYLDKIIDEFGNFRADELKKYIYSLDHTGWKNQRIMDYKKFETIMNPNYLRDPLLNFTLEEDWYDTVELLLNPTLLFGYQKGIRDAQLGNFKSEINCTHENE